MKSGLSCLHFSLFFVRKKVLFLAQSLSQISGLSPEAALRFFGGDEAMYRRFLKRFADDASFASLRLALEKDDVSSAFLFAHTLKGLSKQLGLCALSGPSEVLCELLRPLDPAALPRAKALFAQLEAPYARLVSALKAL